MANKKNTRRALWMSVMSLILCFAMLVGTTFAWFTDEVKSGVNQIKAGNLDVALFNDDGEVTEATQLFKDVDPNLWEPGAVAYENLEVRNIGTLDLKYDLNLTINDQTSVTDESGTHNLSDVIKVGIVEGGVAGTDRNAVLSSVSTWDSLTNFSIVKQNQPLEDGQTSGKIGVVLYWQPNENEIDNLYNLNNGRSGELKLNIGVTLTATQLVSENDSFGPDYDAAAPGDTFDGEPEVPSVDPEDDNKIIIDSAEKLVGFANDVNGGNNYKGKTVVLSDNINLAGVQWTPIGDCNSGKYFQGTFDGQGYTIYNLYVDKSTDPDEHSTAGLFGWIDAAGATIKNVNISKATIKGSHWVGAVAGYTTGRVENCTVSNSTITGYNVNDNANGDKVGGIVGCLNEHSYINGNTVTNCTITGNRDIGGIAGSVAASTYEMKNNSVKNTTLIYTTEKDYGSAGEIVSGRTGYVADTTNTASNVTIYKETAYEGIYQSPTDAKQYYINSKAGLKNLNSLLGAVTPNEANIITVDLMTDVDLSGESWSPINAMWVTFNGNEHTISNINAGFSTDGRRSGFWSYAGAVTINDLTLKNVNVSGSQAGTFVGAAEGTKINNCYLDGTNSVTFVAGEETWNGIGAISGVLTESNINVTIKEGATVTLNKGTMTTDVGCTYIDDLTGYIQANQGTVIKNGTVKVNKIANVENTDGLTAAIADGASDITLSAGTYTMPSVVGSKEFTIKGTKETVIDNTLGAYMDSSKVSFEGVTIKGSTGKANGNGSDYAALYTPNVTYTNCTFDGPFRIGRDGATFINCKFTNLGNDYVWTYGNDATFKGCTFESDGKALLIYSDGGSEVSKVVVEDCIFNATAGAKAGAISNQNCAAIEIQNYGNGVNLTTSGNTIGEHFSGEWRIKTYHAGNPAVIVNGTEYTSLALDGKTMTISGTEVTVNP